MLFCYYLFFGGGLVCFVLSLALMEMRGFSVEKGGEIRVAAIGRGK